ncbi:MBOAT family O-acyltransferase [Pseudoroseomonas globiformis]|uniref:Probable alginate O-acetylase AlgI n=1 Tax=Teichococcus globiformis TaxID=2307229 RepID=A0ABV7G0W3_9PROT
MLFNSWTFVAFFAALMALYLPLGRWKGHQAQNRLLLVASYVFYAGWDWRFCLLLAAISVVDWACGNAIARNASQRRRQLFLGLSVVFDIGVLIYFKYCNFFIQGAADLVGLLGEPVSWPLLNIILPVGISFIVFKSLSYTIDVYRGEIRPERHLLDYALFVAFFPDLVAGPIIRARTVLAQLHAPRRITETMVVEGFWLILFGYFLKVVVADNLAPIANSAFATSQPESWLHVLLGIYAFAFQILGDFAGYSGIAIGVARLMGFVLPPNFGHPYRQTNPQAFWRHWHISLSTWLRDYVYISFGGSRGGNWKTSRNLLATMVLGGLWHGAAWTFLLWGFYHGLLLILHRAMAPVAARLHLPLLSGLGHVLAVLFMFHLTCFGWLLFRAESLAQVGGFLRALALGTSADMAAGLTPSMVSLAMLGGATLLADHALRAPDGTLRPLNLPGPARWACAACLALAIPVFGDFGLSHFIYFQF